MMYHISDVLTADQVADFTRLLTQAGVEVLYEVVGACGRGQVDTASVERRQHFIEPPSRGYDKYA